MVVVTTRQRHAMSKRAIVSSRFRHPRIVLVFIFDFVFASFGSAGSSALQRQRWLLRLAISSINNGHAHRFAAPRRSRPCVLSHL